MIQISKNEFLQMFQIGILKSNNKQNKEWTVTSRAKPGKRKKHYVHEADFQKYINYKNNNPS